MCIRDSYIAVDPGQPGGRFQKDFTGLEGPPGVRSGEPGRTYVLTVNRIGSLQTGSPVLFRDATVGEVLGYDLGNGLAPAKVFIFIKAPFDDLVRPASRFWNVSGISLDVLPGEFHVEFESLQAVLSGAIAFTMPVSYTHLLKDIFRWYEPIKPWAMVDVYLLGFLVAYTRLSAIAQVHLDTAVYSLVGLMISMAAADAALDNEAVWLSLIHI